MEKFRLSDFYFFVISKEKDLTFNSMLKFVNNPQYHDVVLEFSEEEAVDKKYIYAHRLLLSKYSYFESIIDNMCGYEESTEDTKHFMNEYPDEWYGRISNTGKSTIRSVQIASVKSDESYPPEEEKEIAIEEIDESKDDIEFTEESSFKEFSYSDRYSSEIAPLEDFLSDEDDIDLPLRIKMEEISYDTCLDIVRYIYTDY